MKFHNLSSNITKLPDNSRLPIDEETVKHGAENMTNKNKRQIYIYIVVL